MRKLLNIFGALALFGLFSGPAAASCSGVFLPGAVCANFGSGSAIPGPFVLGANVPAALQIAIGDAGAPVLFNGAGGKPSSLDLTNATLVPGMPISPSTNGGVLWDNNGVLGDSKTLPSGLTIPSAALSTLYADGTTGSDSNTGLTAASPLKTIAALTALDVTLPSAKWCVAGYFHEQLNVPRAGMTITDCGVGSSPPTLDASDAIAAIAWTKSGGYTNLYQATAPIDASTSISWVRAWEATTPLVRATSLANADSTAGSYFPSSDTTTPIILYVHPTAGGNPATSGIVYAYSARLFGLASNFPTTIIGISTKRNLSEDGSLYLPANDNLVLNSFALEGNKHNAFFGPRSYVVNFEADDAYYTGIEGLSPLVFYGAPNGLGVVFDHPTVKGSFNGTTSVGILGHVLSGLWGTIQINTPNISNVDVGVNTYDNALTLINGGNIMAGIPVGAASNVTVSHASLIGIGSSIQNANPGLSGVTISVDASVLDASSGNALITANPTIVSITNSSVCSPANQFWMIGTGDILNSIGNTFCDSGSYNIYNLPASVTLTSDKNTFYSSEFTLGATSYATLPAWQAASSQDAASFQIQNLPTDIARLSVAGTWTAPQTFNNTITVNTPGSGFWQSILAGGTTVQGGTIYTPALVGNLPSCATNQGAIQSVSDNTTNTWGATASGGGLLPTLVWCNGTNWTVIGR